MIERVLKSKLVELVDCYPSLPNEGLNELNEQSNVQNLHIANSDKPVKFFSLNVIIAFAQSYFAIQNRKQEDLSLI